MGLKVMVLGSGGREHALAWKIKQSPDVDQIFCIPGNGGTSSIAKNIDNPVTDYKYIVDFAQEKGIDLTVVGPEQPLVDGIADDFRSKGLRIFGHPKYASQLEGSKAYAKTFMEMNNIPTAQFRIFDHPEFAMQEIENMWDNYPQVIKADGLAAGKGVIVPKDEEQAYRAIRRIMVDKEFGDAGSRIIMEDILNGEEASIIGMTDGRKFAMFPPSQDHKPVNDNDKGDNTGGMGAYSPAPVITDEINNEIMEKVMGRTLKAFERYGHKMCGFLYAGLMMTDDGPKVLEFNVRMGDPEAQPLLMRTKSDLVPYMMSAANGEMINDELDIDPRPAVCVVLASNGYPGKYEKGMLINGIEDAEKLDGVEVFHAGTTEIDGQFYTSGGRVLGVTAMGTTYQEAIDRAYEAADMISCDGPGFHKRLDIGHKALNRV